jgi:DNA helicase-2/ATP-dependent DNA helicase PcrA
MVIRKGYNEFWGCTKFPRCKGSRTMESVIRESRQIESQIEEPKAKSAFIPSKYQEAIFHEIKTGTGNLVIEASAGSGKSKTIDEGLAYTPRDSKVAFLAFNVDIVKELKTRVPEHVYCSTLGSLGNRNILNSLRVVFNNNKVNDLFNLYCERIAAKGELEEESLEALKNSENLVKRLVDLTKASLLLPSEQTISELCEKNTINLNGNASLLIAAIQFCFEESVNDRTTIDYSDQVYFCAMGFVPCQQFDVIFVDETQDLTKADTKMILLSLKPGGRIVCVGDRYQSINGFRGADTKVIPYLIDTLKAQVLPLSITYRLPLSHVRFMNEKFPFYKIEASPNAIEGKIEYITSSKMIDLAKEKDLVLCRNNAPMVKPCYAFIAKGIKAYIKGRDIGKGLQSLIKRIAKKNDDISKFLSDLESYRIRESEKLIAAKQTGKLESLIDQTDSIFALSEGIHSVKELLAKTESIFSDHSEGICFSSVHRAKGLESRNVFVYKPDLMPSKSAKTEEQAQQEINVQIVAYSRSKENMYLVSE